MVFRNRQHAGQELAKRLMKEKSEDCVVVALPRGGVPVAAEVARSLEKPLDIIAVRKIGAPSNPELAIGSIAEDGEVIYNDHILKALGLTPDDAKETVTAQMAEIQRQVRLFRGDRAPIEVRGRTVILVDDGLATGATAMAAAKHLRAGGAERIIAAIPACAADSAKRLESEVDELVSPTISREFYAVSQWYENFRQVEDAEVIRLLDEFREAEGEKVEYRKFRDEGEEPDVRTFDRR